MKVRILIEVTVELTYPGDYFDESDMPENAFDAAVEAAYQERGKISVQHADGINADMVFMGTELIGDAEEWLAALEPEEESPSAQIIDLMTALRASLAQGPRK